MCKLESKRTQPICKARDKAINCGWRRVRLYVCAQSAPSPSRVPADHDNSTDRMSETGGALGSALHCRRKTPPLTLDRSGRVDEKRPTRRYAAGRLRADRRQLRPNLRTGFDVQENRRCDLGQASGLLGKRRDRSITPHAGRLTTFCRRQSRWHGLARLGEELLPRFFRTFGRCRRLVS
jgi:hypothetical protein